MRAKEIIIGMAVVAAGGVSALAQTPVLGSIEAPYTSVQGSVQVAGHIYGAGAVAYGPVGTPLVLSGSDLGDTGTVQFVAYKNGVVDTNVSPVVATPTMWTSNMIFAAVPAGALTGMVKVQVEGKTSNLLPFIVTTGTYAGTCPAGPTTTQLQIVTSSLHDGSVGQSYSATLSATGGTQSYAWSVVSGTLPAGLSLNASTGVISGMPTTAVNPASITFEVTDSSAARQSNQAVLDLIIEPQQMTAATVYSYCVPDASGPSWCSSVPPSCSSGSCYDGNGNVHEYQDTVMGTWNFTYDAFNRLQSGSAVTGGTGSQDFAGQNLCWAYDSFGNRTAQVMQTTACPAQESSLTPTQTYNGNNRIASGLVTYDLTGNVTSDASTGNTYVYDAEGRVCALKSEPTPGTYTMTGYIYDADGTRVAKGSITTLSCDPTANGFQITENYVLGPNGEELSMLDGSNNWQRTNVYAGGKLVGTYDGNGLHFHLEDPLGTRRVQLSGNPNCLGVPDTDIQGLPYGDGLYSFPDQYACATADDATPLHFTGKERDTESGNDYFGARYYASAMGRFMSPDWSAQAEPVPYAKLGDPQSLNLYAYVRNNPLSRFDPDGHCVVSGGMSGHKMIQACSSSPIYANQAPRNADGTLKPPPTSLPDGKNGKPNEWVIKDSGKGNRVKWGPRYSVPSVDGGQPSASWDDRTGKKGVDHWDVEDGSGSRARVDENGKPISEADAHGRPFILDPTLFPKPESFGDQINDLRNFIHDLVDYATHFHPQPGFSPGTAPHSPGGYIPVVPPPVYALP